MKKQKQQLVKRLSLALAAALLAGVLLVTAGAAEFRLPEGPDWDDLTRDPGNAPDNDFSRDFQRSADISLNDPPVFYLWLTGGSEQVCVTAFYARDPATGSSYLMTYGLIGELIEEGGISCSLETLKGRGDVEYLGQDGVLAYFRSDILSSFTPMELGKSASDLVDIYFLGPDESGNPKEIMSIGTIDLNQWETENEILFMDTETEPTVTLFLGMPVVSAEDGTVVGFTFVEQYLGIFRFGGTKFELSQEYALSTSAQDTPAQGEGSSESSGGSQSSGGSESPDGSGAKEQFKDNTTLYLVLGAAAVAALLFYKKRIGKKPQKSNSGSISLDSGAINVGGADSDKTESNTDYQADGQDIYGPTVPTPSTAPQPPYPAPENGTVPLALWQLRGVEGPLCGKVYPLGGSVTIGRNAQCGVRFSQDAPGISGVHCQVHIKDGQVYIQDLGSSYGTFYPQSNRLNPRTDYPLHEGGVFNLAQGGGAFRLEKAGAADASRVVIKDMDGKTYRSDASMRITLGRSPGCQGGFGSGESSISGKHCVLYRESGKLYLMDLDSTNGTFFSQQERLRPNVPYRVRKGMAFFLTTPKYTFVVLEE